MRNGCGWADVRAMVVALALGVGSEIEAGAIKGGVMYSTSGMIDATRISEPDVIAFHGVARDELRAPGPLLLGEFRVDALPEGRTARFDRAPFWIELNVDGADPVSLSGVLDGTVTGGGASDLRATFEPTPVVPTYPTPPSGFERWLYGADGVTGILGLPDHGIALGADDGGRTAVRAQIRALEPHPVPEPATAAALLTALAAMAWRRRQKSCTGLRTED
jgi:hypothetical protein